MNLLNLLNNDIKDIIYKYLHESKMKEVCEEIRKSNVFNIKLNIEKKKDICKNGFKFNIIIKNNHIKCMISNVKKNEVWKNIEEMNECIGKNKRELMIKRRYSNIFIN
tara:strand:+ start:10721 stop:11044 length:324 start_codon:yes stop_codon:yes gene_type:complete